MRARRTPTSLENEKLLKRDIRDYDNELELHFSTQEGFYYISRPFKGFDEKDAAEMLEKDSTVFADAMKRRQLVVCYPLPVKMIENYDFAKRNILRHLRKEDSRPLGATKEQRVRMAEQANDEVEVHQKAKRESFWKGERQAYSREYFRDHVQARAYFGGVKRLEAVHG